LLHNKIKETEEWKKGEVKESLEKGFQETEIYITNYSAKNKTESGTTAVSIILKEEMEKKELFAANLGDTEAILVSIKPKSESQILIESNSLLESDGGELCKPSVIEYEYFLITEKHSPGYFFLFFILIFFLFLLF
jgi:hypothetical protein